jgi:hypothetical protein
MRSIRRFQPVLNTMPVRIAPADMLNPMAPVIIPYGPTDPPPPPLDPMAPVVISYSTCSPLAYADT